MSHAYPRRHSSSHGIFVHRLHRAMVSLGHEVEVVQRGDWAPTWPFYLLHRTLRASHRERSGFLESIDGIRVHHPLTFRPRPSRFFPGDSWEREADSIRRLARRRLRKRDFDVVLAHFLVPDGYHALALGDELGLPVAGMAWGDDVHAWPAASEIWATKLRVVMRSANALIACSAQMAQDAAQWLDPPRADWHVVYGGVDLDLYQPAEDRAAARVRALPPDLVLRMPHDAKIVLVLAQPASAKGYLELLDAWAELAPSHVDWWLVMAGGPGGDLDMPNELAMRGALPRVEWLGPQPPERIPDLLGASDAFALPSHNEGLSLSMLEALASGVPTIATNVGGHAEVMSEAADGWLIPPRDAAALGAALSELMSNEGERQRRGARGRRAAERIGSPLDNARRLIAILDQTIACHNSDDRKSNVKRSPLSEGGSIHSSHLA